MEALKYTGRKNVNACLEDAARKRNFDKSLLDFRILKITTNIFDTRDNKLIEEVDNTRDAEISNKYIMDKNCRLEQAYDIEVIKKEENPKVSCQLSYTANYTNTRLTLTFRAGSKFIYYAELGEHLYDEINKRVIQYGYLAKIFEHDLRAKIDRFTKIITPQHLVLERDVKLTVAENRAFQEPVTEQMIVNLKDRVSQQDWDNYIENQETKKLIIEVQPDETLMTLKKPKYGNASMDLYGCFLEVGEPTFFRKEISIGKNVLIEEDEDNTYYKSQIIGSVNYKENAHFVHIDVSEELYVQKVGFRETGDINLQNTKLSIEEKNIALDSISDNVRINTDTLHVKGFIGKLVTINCKELVVDGGTHSSDILCSEKAFVKICNCYLECKEAEITMADGAKIYMHSATIETMNKTELKGKSAGIDSLQNYNTITFSDTLAIKEVKGFNNKIIASSITTKDEEAKYAQFKEELEVLKKEHKEIHKQFNEYVKKIESAKKVVDATRVKIAEIKKNGYAMPVVYTKQLQAYNELIKKAGEVRAELKEVADMEHLKEDELNFILEQSLNSRIVCDFVWPEYNEITFVVNGEEVKFKPECKNYGAIYLEHDGAGYKIKGEK